MELSSTGWRLVLAAAALSLVGAIFAYPIAIVVTTILLLNLLIEGTDFHRSTNLARTSLTVKSNPQTIRCKVGEQLEFEHIISNPTNRNFRIIASTHKLQPKLGKQDASFQTLFLARRGKRTVRTLLECDAPGRFEIQTVKIGLASRSNIFRESILTHAKTIVIARPKIKPAEVSSIDSSFLDYLTSDRIRRGTGTDLAGIRPSALMEDSHRIDWKATARTGKLMVKEFYLEREPGIVLALDSSRTMRAKGLGMSMISQILATLPTLIASIKTAIPIGLTMFDEHSILLEVPVGVGESHRELILRHVLNSTTSNNAPLLGIAAPEDFASVTRKGSSVENRKYWHKLVPFLPRLDIFHSDIHSRRHDRLRKEGAFIGLMRMGTYPDSRLIIAVTDGRTNLPGLIEGARIASLSGHRVIIAILSTYQKIPTAYLAPELETVGVKMHECLPSELPSVVRFEIKGMSRERFVPSNLLHTYAEPGIP